MEKNPGNVDKDLSRIAGLIANIRYAEPPESFAEKVLANIKPKRMTLLKRLWRRLRTPIPVSPLRLLPAGVSVLAIFALALTLLWRDPGQRVVTQKINEVASQGLNTVMLFLDRPDATDVEVIGSFNKWSQEGVRMVWDKDRGLWVVALHLKRGSYEYAFRVNNREIVADPKAILHRDDGFGHQNSILIIGNGNGNETRI
jgi:Carbohydrate-binding module 48 (Isoamylase N-terminal domain)